MVVAIIPARGGSKGLPRKNLALLAGKPLIVHTISQALEAVGIDRVFVSTDDREIAGVAQGAGAEVIERPLAIAGDGATSESALLHALEYVERTEGLKAEQVVLLQCTSPIRKPDDIDGAIKTLTEQRADSLLSVYRTHAFIWRRENHEVRALNYDPQNRPRRQDMKNEYLENGSIYVFKPWVLKELKSRLGGRIALYEMDYWSSFQVDTREDLQVCEWILAQQMSSRRSVATR